MRKRNRDFVYRARSLKFSPVKVMHRIAPTEKDTDNAELEKRLWDAVNQFRANSGCILQTTGSHRRRFRIAGGTYPLVLAVMRALTPRMTPVEFRKP